MEQRITDLQTPSSCPAAATTPTPLHCGLGGGGSQIVTLSHCRDPWRYLCLFPLSISLIIHMVQVKTSGSPTYRSPAAALQLQLPPHPFSGGLFRGRSQRVTNVECRDPWRYLYLFPLSISLIIHMVQVWSSGFPTYRSPTPALQLQLPPHPFSGGL